MFALTLLFFTLFSAGHGRETIHFVVPADKNAIVGIQSPARMNLSRAIRKAARTENATIIITSDPNFRCTATEPAIVLDIGGPKPDAAGFNITIPKTTELIFVSNYLPMYS